MAELSDIGRFSAYADPNQLLLKNNMTIGMFRENPFLRGPEQVAQTLGIVAGRIVGGVCSFPRQIIADGTVYETSANPGLFVHPDFRKTGLALDLIERCWNRSKDHIALDFYVSPQARGVVRMMGGAVFDIAQYAIIRKSSKIIGSRMRKWAKVLVAPLLDLVFAIHRCLLLAVVSVKTWSWRFQLADDDDSLAEFSSLIANDQHRFRENMPPDCLKWILNHDFLPLDKANKHLWRVVKAGQTIGFVLTRVTLDGGSRVRILEWQMTAGNELLMPWLLLKAALRSLGQNAAAIISVGASESAARVFKWILPPISVQASTVGVGDESPLEKHMGWRDQRNWRIRPAMGDCAFY